MNQRSVLKLTLIELLAEEGQLSTKDIIIELQNRRGKNSSKYKERQPQTIRDALKEMVVNKNPLIELVREKQSRRGKNEKFYSLTFEGSKWHLLQNNPTIKNFWKMVVIHSDASLDRCIKTKFKPKRSKNFPVYDNQKIVEDKKRKFPIDVIDLVKFYEEKILQVYQNYFYSHNIKNVLNHFRYSTDEDLSDFEKFRPILEILADNPNQIYYGVMAYLAEKEENVETKYKPILELMYKKGIIFYWETSVGNEYSLSVTGILLTLDLWNQKYLDPRKKYALWHKRQVMNIEDLDEKESILDGYKNTHPELYELIIEKETKDEKILKEKIKKLVKNYSELFPIIFSEKNWRKLHREIDIIELVTTLVDPYFENIEMGEGAYDQKNELLLLNTVEGIRRIYSLELHRLYRAGLDICSAFAKGSQCEIPIMNQEGLVTDEAIFLIYAPQEEYMKFAEMQGYTQKDLATFYIFLWKSMLILHRLQIKLSKSDSLEFELNFSSIEEYNQKSSSKSVVNVISFEFLNQLKMHNPNRWKKIMQNDSLREFYKNWIDKIQSFDTIERNYQLDVSQT